MKTLKKNLFIFLSLSFFACQAKVYNYWKYTDTRTNTKEFTTRKETIKNTSKVQC